jgi:transposase
MKLRVAYARGRYKDKVYETPLIVTSYRDEKGTARNRTICSLTQIPRSVVSLIDAALKKGDTDILEDFVSVKDLSVEQSLSVGPGWTVLNIMKQLGIYSLLKEKLTSKQAAVITAIINERVTAGKPLSVMALQRRFSQEVISYLLGMEKSPALNTWYEALAKLEHNREDILIELFRQNNKPGELYLYDITSSYFEGTTCPIADFGYNRDGKQGKMQVVIGVICDEAGCPLWIDVFRGNTSDQTTVKQQLITLKEKLGLEGFTFVGDRGMVTHARIEELQKEGWWDSFTYITALTRQEMMSLVEDEDHPVQLELFDNLNLAEVEHNSERFVLCHNPERMGRDRETRERLLSLTESKLSCILKNVQSGRIKNPDVISRRVNRWLDRWGMRRFFKTAVSEGSFSFERNREEIERYVRLDGCYVIRSNTKKHTSRGLLDRYKDLKCVEQAFRTMKTTDINTRPIRHFNEPQVRGHIFACFLAYRIVWELRQRLFPVLQRDHDTARCEAGSLAEIWRELGAISLIKINSNNKTWFKLSTLTPYAAKLLILCKIPSLNEILR